MRMIYAAALLAAGSAVPAFAQDAAPSQGGFRIEAIAGYDAAEIIGDSDGGVVYGVGVGYDFQAGRALLGVEAEATDSTNDGCVANVAQAGDSICAAAGRDLYVGARAGIMVSRTIELYARAGYTNARFNIAYDDGTPGGAGDTSFSQNLDGVRVGAGAQFRIGRHAYVSGEYRYSNYEQGSDRGQFLGAVGFRF